MPWSFVFIVLSFVVSACAGSKLENQVSDPSQDRVKASEPAQIAAIKRPTSVREKTQATTPSLSEEEGVFFAKIQILAQTEAQADCAEDFRRFEDVIEDFWVELLPNGELKKAKKGFSDAYFNVTVRAIGFDESRFRFSLINGEERREMPYQIKFLARPNKEIEIQYFDQSIRLNPEATPVYSFTASENRGPCVIDHTVNIYSEAVGRYSLSED